MLVQRKDSGEDDMYVIEQAVDVEEVDVEEGGASLEDERGRRVGGTKEVGRYNGDDSGVEDNDEEKNDLEDVENPENMDVDADG